LVDKPDHYLLISLTYVGEEGREIEIVNC